MANSMPSQFESGFIRARDMWRSGQTWESIVMHSRDEPPDTREGMLACVDVLSGWVDCARRQAIGYVRPHVFEEMIASASNGR